MGLATQGVDIAEKTCHQYDHTLRLQQGEVEENLLKLYEQLEEVSEAVENIDLEIVKLEEKMEEKTHEIAELEDEHLECFTKNGKICLSLKKHAGHGAGQSTILLPPYTKFT